MFLVKKKKTLVPHTTGVGGQFAYLSGDINRLTLYIFVCQSLCCERCSVGVKKKETGSLTFCTENHRKVDENFLFDFYFGCFVEFYLFFRSVLVIAGVPHPSDQFTIC